MKNKSYYENMRNNTNVSNYHEQVFYGIKEIRYDITVGNQASNGGIIGGGVGVGGIAAGVAVGMAFPPVGVGIALAGLFAPVVGVGVGAAVSKTESHIYYFDNNTGEFLASTKDEAARKLDGIGHDLFKQGKHAEAAEHHKNAYYACTSGYTNEQSFRNNWYNAGAEVKNQEGHELKAAGNYAEAMAKYEQAFERCPDIEGVFQDNRKIYQNNKSNALNAWGNDLYNQGKYLEAAEKYKLASETCTNDCASKQIFEGNRDYALGRNLSIEGDSLYEQGSLDEAINKYQTSLSFYNSAINKVRIEHQEEILRQKEIVQSKVESALSVQIEQRFNKLISEGEAFYKEGEQERSQENFDEALGLFTKSENKFDEASHLRLSNLLLPHYVKLILSYKEMDEGQKAEKLLNKCKETFTDSNAQSLFASIKSDIDNNIERAWEDYIQDIEINDRSEEQEIIVVGEASEY